MTHLMRFPAKGPAVLCLTVCLAVISCARGRDGERIEKQGTSRDEAVPEQARPDSVTAYVDLVEMGYAALEPIPLRLIVRNEAGRTLHLTFPTAQRFDFIITKDREPVWSWGQGRMFAQALGRVALAPGDSAVYEYTWDGRLPGGSLPRLGRYTVKGVLMTMPPVETEAREFGIVD